MQCLLSIPGARWISAFVTYPNFTHKVNEIDENRACPDTLSLAMSTRLGTKNVETVSPGTPALIRIIILMGSFNFSKEIKQFLCVYGYTCI